MGCQGCDTSRHVKRNYSSFMEVEHERFWTVGGRGLRRFRQTLWREEVVFGSVELVPEEGLWFWVDVWHYWVLGV